MKLHEGDCSFNWKVTEVVEALQQVAYRASFGHGPSGRTPDVEGDLSLPEDRKSYVK